MSTAQRRRGKSLHLELPDRLSAIDGRPPIAALFLIRFDVKRGYTIAWKQCIPGLELAESVEFKSLPSGLHNVKEDLVYFMHDDEHAGISAFVNRSDEEWERNAMMIAVGALVPLDHGRLGKSWKHAENLKELADLLVLDPTKTQPLEEFWKEHQLSEAATSSEASGSHSEALQMEGDQRSRSQSSSRGQPRNRNRGISSASGWGLPNQGLSPHHPALSLPSLLDAFGPLVYPLYKAALLRKRILILNQAPVELVCNFVYDISIISNIPSSVTALLPLEPLPTRLQPLFSVGVYDIDCLKRRSRLEEASKDELLDEEPQYGWVACSTDDVLSMKTDLYDLLVTLPPSYSQQARQKVWPKLRTSQGQEMLATQRDLRRYRTLRQNLQHATSRSRTASPYTPKNASTQASTPSTTRLEDSTTHLLPLENTQETFDDASSTSDAQLIEPMSWPALAYSSFMWWASAGEKRADLDEESDFDSALFRDLASSYAGTPGRSRPRRLSSPHGLLSASVLSETAVPGPELALIAYFHRLSSVIFATLAEVLENCDAEAVVPIESQTMVSMGLDAWSEGDCIFVAELVELYWGREARVVGARVDCCGIRVC